MTERKDPSSSDHAKQLLISQLKRGRALRDDRRAVNEDLKEWRADLKAQGFDPQKAEEVIRWQEKVEDLGREIVDEQEAMFELYRSVADGAGVNLDELMSEARDRALLKQFAPDDQLSPKPPTKKQKAASDALAMAEMNRALRGDS